MKHFDIIIVGGGSVGSSIAWRLSRYDLSVAVVDKEVDVAIGTTGRNSAVVHAGFNITARKELFNQHIVTADGNALIEVVEIVIVIGETAGQALNNRRRQLAARAPPLLLRITLDELLKNIAPHKGECLLLQITRLVNILRRNLLGNLSARFFGRANPPHLRKSIHIERQIVDFAVIVSDRGVDVIIKLGKTINVIPHILHRRVENMCPVTMELNTVNIFGINIAR